MKLIIPMPPSINRTYKTGNGRFYKSREAHDWSDLTYWRIKEQYKGKPLAGRLEVKLSMFFYKNADIDSRLKAVLDVLQLAKVIENDIDIVTLIVYKHVDKTITPEVWVEISKL